MKVRRKKEKKKEQSIKKYEILRRDIQNLPHTYNAFLIPFEFTLASGFAQRMFLRFFFFPGHPLQI